MKTQCGGILLDNETLRTIEGVICEANTLFIPEETLTTACGQQWDGENFKATKVGNEEVITYCVNGGEIVGKPIIMYANCGLGVDKRFFKLTADGKLKLNGGYLLKLNVYPEDATVTVLDSDAEEILPISGTLHQYICDGDVSVTVQKAGYEGKSQTVTMSQNRELDVTLDKVWTLTINVSPSDATLLVDQNGEEVQPTPEGSNTYICHEGAVDITAYKVGYDAYIEEIELKNNQTLNITINPES